MKRYDFIKMAVLTLALMIAQTVFAQDSSIGSLKPPYTKKQIDSVGKLMTTTDGPAFQFFMDHRSAIDSTVKPGYAHDKILPVIFKSKIKPLVPNDDSRPDWELVREAVKPYGKFGEEMFLRARAFHYRAQKDWPKAVPAFQAYFKAYPNAVSSWDLNDFAWSVFLETNDKRLLSKALKWSKYALDNYKGALGLSRMLVMDTYANLLYKLERTKQAIGVEKDAMEQAKAKNDDDYKVFETTLAKMEAGQPTWSK